MPPMRRRDVSSFYRGSSQGDERRRRIEQVLIHVAREVGRGEAVDPGAIESEHADLMPELASDLRLLLAAQRRGVSAADEPREDPIETILDEELAVLQASLEQFEIFERVRYGGQGVVYRARQKGMERDVALKVLLDGPLATDRQRARFAHEIELVSRLQHPNIVTVYESGVVRGRNFYAMEFVNGDPIDDYAELKDLTPRQIVALLVRVCRAVQCAHQNGIIHRDLNPSNILVDRNGEPRVFDFGLAKDLWEAPSAARVTMTGVGCGTLPYLSPEQAGADDGVTDVRTDVYALGLILYELLSGMFPYPIQGEPKAIQEAIRSEEPRRLRKVLALGNRDWAPERGTIDRDLEEVVAKALAKEKKDRYQSVAALSDDLERWLNGDAVAARVGGTAYRLRKTLRRHKLAASVAAVILTCVAVSGAAVTRFWLQARAERDNARAAAQTAFDLFDTTMTDVAEAVRPLAGGTLVRDRLIKRLAGSLAKLKSVTSADETLHALAVRLLEKQGDVALQLGQREAAAEYFQAFLQANQPGSANRLNDGRSDTALLRAYRKLAVVSPGARELLERGLAVGEGLLARSPQDDDVRYESCRLAIELQRNLYQAGRFAEALPHATRAVELSGGGAGEPGAPVSRWDPVRAEALSGQGDALLKLGEFRAARESIEAAVRGREAILAANPADTEARRACMNSRTHLGTLLRDAGELEEGRAQLRRAAEHSRMLGTLDAGRHDWDMDRYGAHHLLAVLTLERGDVAEATKECAAATALAQAWVAREKSAEAQSTLHFALLLEGKLRMKDRDAAGALVVDLEAVRIAETLVAADPDNLRLAKQAAAAHHAVAEAARACLDTDLALEERCRAHELHQQVAELQPGVAIAQIDLATSECNLALAHLDLRSAADCAAAGALVCSAEERLLRLDADANAADSVRRRLAGLLDSVQRYHELMELYCGGE